MEYSEAYCAFMGLSPKRIPHWEHWSCPDAETFITGIDHYEHPKLCRERMNELYPLLRLGAIASDEPRPRPKFGPETGESSADDEGGHKVRWGDGESWQWDWGKTVRTADEVFAFSPLEHADFTSIPVVESKDFSSVEKLYETYRRGYPAEWGDRAPEGSTASVGFYNTMFMWPLLTFGWELFLETCLDERFERIMDEFAEINRRVFTVFSRLPANFVVCHDDIVNSRGPVCSPAWMHKHVFPRYEEFWGMVKATGKRVIFMSDGCMDKYADDVLACGASGIVTEPYTDFKSIARRHENVVLAGEGDVRTLMRGSPEEVRVMVESMVETARTTGGYFMCIGNHIPWNTPPAMVKLYLDLCSELAHR